MWDRRMEERTLFFLLHVVKHEVKELIIALEDAGNCGGIRKLNGTTTRETCLVGHL